jgi:cysteine desulfurase/selenocysteine lyase
MSTSEPEKTRGPERGKSAVGADTWDASKGLPAGLPDPAVLARMATEFFTALPEFAQLGKNASAQETLPPSIPVNVEAATLPQDVIASAAPPGISFLTEPGLSALPWTLSRPHPPPAPLAAWGLPVTVPAIPGEWTAAAASIAPSFSFLEEARPLFADDAGPRIPSAPFQSAPTGFSGIDLSAILPGVPNSADSPSVREVGAPGIAGAPVRPEASDKATSYSFLNEARQLSSVNVIPVLEPISSQEAPLADLGLSSRSFEVGEIRRDFPILQERVNGRPLVWLDNAATTQKPQSVIDRLSYFYEHENSNVHRAAHELAARATDAYEAARDKTRRFLNASSVREIVFVRGATEGINLIAKSWGQQNVQKDDEVVITWLEHHANIVPWQMLCAEKGARLRVAPVDDSGQVILDEYAKLLGPRTRLVSLPQVSNALGTVTPAKEMIEMAHRHGAAVVLDGAQAVSHMPVDVQWFDCDFYVFSGHKVFAPTGIGVVYGKSDILDRTPPWQGGGNMIQDVTFEKTVYNVPPARFEAGTGNIADAVGLGAAIDYVQRIGMANIARYEHDLLAYTLGALRKIPGLHLIGTPKEQAGVVSFVLDGFRTEDVGTALNREGIAVRAGHHCAQPILRRFGVESTVRASLALYNTCEEIDTLVAALWNLKQGRGAGLV